MLVVQIIWNTGISAHKPEKKRTDIFQNVYDYFQKSSGH